MYKTFKYKLEPNKKQRLLIARNIGCCRFIYNQILSEKQIKYQNQDKSKCKTEKEYKTEFSFLKEAESSSLQQSRLDLTKAYTNFFRKIKLGERTSLRFKSRKNPKNSYRIINNNNNIKIKDNYIKIPKIGLVKFRKSREIKGKITSITIIKNILNKYYICILCELSIEKLSKLNKNIGIDLGIKDYLVDSNDHKEPNHKYLRKLELKLKKIQRIFSRKHRDSNRREKMRKKLFKIHEKISNQRFDFLHKLSSRLINENQVICLESLKVKNMLKNHKLAKSISDCSWSKFVELLKYKASWYGRELSQINTFFPSSKLCSECGNIKKDLTLKDRVYRCENCGLEIDRDYNAAINILREGLKILKEKNRRNGGVSSVNNKTLVLSS